MKKIIGILAGVIIIAIIFSIFWDGLGIGIANGDAVADKNNDSTKSQLDTTETEENKESQNKYDSVYVISVVKSDYIYNNKSIKLDEFLRSLENVNGNFIIEIIDDNASLKAYTRLTENLDSLKIAYTEKP